MPTTRSSKKPLCDNDPNALIPSRNTRATRASAAAAAAKSAGQGESRGVAEKDLGPGTEVHVPGNTNGQIHTSSSTDGVGPMHLNNALQDVSSTEHQEITSTVFQRGRSSTDTPNTLPSSSSSKRKLRSSKTSVSNKRLRSGDLEDDLDIPIVAVSSDSGVSITDSDGVTYKLSIPDNQVPVQGSEVSCYVINNDDEPLWEGAPQGLVKVQCASPAQRGNLPQHAHSGDPIYITFKDGSVLPGNAFESKEGQAICWVQLGFAFWFHGNRFFETASTVDYHETAAEYLRKIHSEDPVNKNSEKSSDEEDKYHPDSDSDSNDDDMSPDAGSGTIHMPIEIEDDDSIYGSEGEEAEDEEWEDIYDVDASAADARQSPSDVDPEVLRLCRSNVEFILRGFLQTHREMCDDVSYEDFKVLPRGERPMTMGSYLMVRNTSVEALVTLYMSAFTDEAILELARLEDLTFEGLNSLSNNGENELLKAVYTNTMIRRLGPRNAQGYVGSVPRSKRGAFIRIRQHKSLIRRRSQESAHYRFATQPGVQSHFRILARLPNDTPEGYVIYLEAILMIWLDYYQYPGFYSPWNPSQTYDWTRRLRESHPHVAHLPSLGITGINRAWPLFQGFSNPKCRQESECRGLHCDTITKPSSQRYVADSRLPLSAGYYCNVCYNYRRTHGGRDRTAEHVRRQKDVQRYSEGDRCSDCDTPLSQRNFVKGRCRKCCKKYYVPPNTKEAGIKCKDCPDTFKLGDNWVCGRCPKCTSEKKRQHHQKEHAKNKAAGKKQAVVVAKDGQKCKDCPAIFKLGSSENWSSIRCHTCHRKKKNAVRGGKFPKAGTKCKDCPATFKLGSTEEWSKPRCHSCHLKWRKAGDKKRASNKKSAGKGQSTKAAKKKPTQRSESESDENPDEDNEEISDEGSN